MKTRWILVPASSPTGQVLSTVWERPPSAQLKHQPQHPFIVSIPIGAKGCQSSLDPSRQGTFVSSSAWMMPTLAPAHSHVGQGEPVGHVFVQ